jgi:hypothetical protein
VKSIHTVCSVSAEAYLNTDGREAAPVPGPSPDFTRRHLTRPPTQADAAG